MPQILKAKGIDFSQYDFSIGISKQKLYKGFFWSGVFFLVSLLILRDEKATGLQVLAAWVLIAAFVLLLCTVSFVSYKKKFDSELEPALAIGDVGLLMRKGGVWGRNYKLYKWEELETIKYYVMTFRRTEIPSLYLVVKGEVPYIPNPLSSPKDQVPLTPYDAPEERIIAEVSRYMPIENLP